MEIGNILSADVLDIIFDERNKEYGAYDLRKNYRQRLMKAMASMLLVVVLLLVAYMLVAAIRPAPKDLIKVSDFTLENIPDKPKQEEKMVVPPPVKQEVVEIKTKMFTKFLITPDEKVPDDERPPEQTDMDNVKIGTVNRDGVDDGNIIAPPVAENKGIIEAPKKQDADDGGFVPVEVESQYPGGNTAWGAFLNRNLNYPQHAIDNEIQGTVFIQFVVDAEGNVSEVLPVSGPDELRAAAVAVIKKSGKWTPALQNGRHVKSHKKQPVTFRLDANQ